MKTFILIAWRNIWRNRRRTLITTGAIIFSIAIVFLSITLNDGSHDDMLSNAIRQMTGYIQIQEKGYQDDPVIERSFQLDPELLQTVRNIPGVTAVSPRLQVPGLAATGDNSAGAMIIGVDPSTEPDVTVIPRRIIKGNFLRQNLSDSPVREIIVGDIMAKNLNLEVGSDLALVSQGIDGSLGALRFTVVGIYQLGTGELERSVTMIHIEEARDLVRAYDMVNSIAINIDSPGNAEKITGLVRDIVIQKPDSQLRVLGWQELIPELVQAVTIDKIGAYLFLFPLIVIVVFGILSTIFASVLERTREFGIMLALGTRPGQIIQLVLMETFLLTSLGLILGVALGLGLSFYFRVNPINLPQSYEEMSKSYGMANQIRAAIYPVRLTIAAMSVVVLSMLFSLWPAWKASRLKPDQAIRDQMQ